MKTPEKVNYKILYCIITTNDLLISSVMPAIWCAPHVGPNSPVVPPVEVSWAAISVTWPWKKWPLPSCSPAATSPRVAASPCSTQRKPTTRRPVNSGPIPVPVLEPVVNGKDRLNKSCHISCRSINPSRRCRARILFS